MNTIINKLNIKYFITLIFIFFPISFVVGPAVIELFNLFLIYFFYKKVNENKELLKIFKSKILITLLIFNLVILISSINSDYIYSIKYPLTFFRYIIFALSIFLILSFDNTLIKKIIYLFVFLWICLFLGSIYELTYKNYCGYFNSGSVFIPEGEICIKLKNYLIGNLIRPDRMSSLFGEEMVLGSFVSRFLPLLVGLIFLSYSKIKYPKKLMYLAILLSLIMIIISGERAALIYFIFFIFIFFWIVNEKFLHKIYFILLLTVICMVAYFSLDQVSIRMKQTFSQLETSLNNKILFSADHHSHAVSAYKIFLDNKILGIGPNTFREVCKNKKYFLEKKDIEAMDTKLKINQNNMVSGCSSHPHNLYLQLLSETGIIGISIPLLLQIVIILMIIKNILNLYGDKNNNKIRCEILILSCFLISLFPFIPSGNFFNNWLNFIYFYPLGFYFYLKKNVH